MATPLARTARPARTLGRLAAERATGTLLVQGEPDGIVHLWDGSVTGALVHGSGPLAAPTRVPSAPGTPAAEVDALLEIADQVFVMCWGRVRECRFTAAGPPDPREPAPTVRVPVARLLAEVDRRTAALSADGPPVDPLSDRLRRTGPVPRALTVAERDLIDAVDGDVTCADLAPDLGRSVFGTALDATRLVQAGLLEVVPERAGQLTSLNRRRPGASRVHPRDPAPALFDRSDPEVVDRLMSALDSLRAARRFAEPADPS